MNSNWQRYVDAASDFGNLTAARAEQIINQIKSSDVAEQASELVDELMERQRKNREAISALVRAESVRAVHGMGLATAKDVERLRKRVADLEARLAAVEAVADAGGAAVTQSPAKKAGKKAPAKKATKKAPAKKAAKKAPAKKAAKKAPAKKAVKKASGKKAAVTQTAAKKAAVKKTAAKKTAVKKTAAKKTAVKKTAAKKST